MDSSKTCLQAYEPAAYPGPLLLVLVFCMCVSVMVF